MGSDRRSSAREQRSPSAAARGGCAWSGLEYPIRVSLVNDGDHILGDRMRLLFVVCLGIVTASHCPLGGGSLTARGAQGRTLTGVRDFGVVADSGRPARDGRLVTRGNLLTIVSSDNLATAIVDAPAELQRHVGERVWVAGGVMAAPTAFGVIPELPPETGPVANACSPSRIQKGGGRG